QTHSFPFLFSVRRKGSRVMLLWDTEPHQQHIHRGAPLPEVTIAPSSSSVRNIHRSRNDTDRRRDSDSLTTSPRRGGGGLASPSSVNGVITNGGGAVALLSTSASSRPFTTCYNTYRSLQHRQHHHGSSRSVCGPGINGQEDEVEARWRGRRLAVDILAAVVPQRRLTQIACLHPRQFVVGQQRLGCCCPRSTSVAAIITNTTIINRSLLINKTRVLEDRSVSTDLLTAAKQFRDIFLPSTGKRAMNAITLFQQSLHLPDGDREILLTSMNRCQHFMSEVEGLLRCSVDTNVSLDKSVVHFAYLRWGEAHELCRGVKKVLQHRHSGVTMYFPDAAAGGGGGVGGAVVVPSVVQRRGGISPARAVMSRGVGDHHHRHGRRGSPHAATPTSFRRLCAHALPTFESIASRWSPRRGSTPRRIHHHHHHTNMTDNSNIGEYVGSWRSAVDELRERELRETEKNLLQRLLALPADTFDEILHLQ
ncbi:Hypothetical protein, putative, partial [Bodo saltans]